MSHDLCAELCAHFDLIAHEYVGKCATCYEIDKIRRCNEGRMIQEMCKKAHAIHRGGMFMKERMR